MIRKIYIISHSKRLLKANDNKLVDLTTNCKEREVWTLEQEEDYFYIKSHHETYLRGDPDKTVNLTTNCGEWERWTFEEEDGRFYIKSSHNTYLRADQNGNINLTTNCGEWERWIFKEQKPQFYIKSSHETYLRADPDKTVNLTTNHQEWERWTLEQKKDYIYIKSSHDTYLRADPDGTVGLTTNCKEWERWTLEQKKDYVYIKSVHDTYLRADLNGNINLTKNKELWERWEIIKKNIKNYYISEIDRVKYYSGDIYNSQDIVYQKYLIDKYNLNTKSINNLESRYKTFFNMFSTKNIKLLLSNQDEDFMDTTNYKIARVRRANRNISLSWSIHYDYSWKSVYIKDLIQFKDKQDKIFWRGSTTGYNNDFKAPKGRYTFVSKWIDKDPDIDIGFSNITQDRTECKEYYKPGVDITNYHNYKYLISLEGNAEAGGLNWKLASNSVVLMPKPRYFTWLMEDKLVPDYHYILLEDNFSNLREKLDWMRKYPEKVEEIIKNANEYMNMFLDKEYQLKIERQVIEMYINKVLPPKYV